MTERERLIELCNTNNGWVDEVPAEQFADYLIKNGVILPPCKVGDKVFILDDEDYVEYVITEFCIGTLQELRAFAKCGISGYQNIQDCPEYFCGQAFCSTSFPCKNFGKTVFLTREEAEKALNKVN